MTNTEKAREIAERGTFHHEECSRNRPGGRKCDCSWPEDAERLTVSILALLDSECERLRAASVKLSPESKDEAIARLATGSVHVLCEEIDLALLDAHMQREGCDRQMARLLIKSQGKMQSLDFCEARMVKLQCELDLARSAIDAALEQARREAVEECAKLYLHPRFRGMDDDECPRKPIEVAMVYSEMIRALAPESPK